jgi:hypothetical protein
MIIHRHDNGSRVTGAVTHNFIPSSSPGIITRGYFSLKKRKGIRKTRVFALFFFKSILPNSSLTGVEMLPIKLSYNQEVRRIQLSSAVQDSQISYSVLMSAAYSLFPVLTNKTLTFLWCDDEDDNVYCSTDEEIQEAVRIMRASKRSTFKFDVLAPNRTNMEAPCGPIHRPFTRRSRRSRVSDSGPEKAKRSRLRE